MGSTTAGAVDNFVYEDANDTYIADEDIRRRMLDKNPDALRDMVQTFLEAASKGHWDTSEENLERLRDVHPPPDACALASLSRGTNFWYCGVSIVFVSRLRLPVGQFSCACENGRAPLAQPCSRPAGTAQS